MVTLLGTDTSAYHLGVYNAFIEVLNKLLDACLIGDKDVRLILKQLGFSKGEFLTDEMLEKNVYHVFEQHRDLFKEVDVDYPWLLDRITEIKLQVRQNEIEAEEKGPKSVYSHLIGAAQRIYGYRDKLEMANAFWEIQPFFYDKARIWWLWDDNMKMWNMVDEVDLFNSLDTALGTDQTLKTSQKTEILEAMKRVGRGRQPEPIKKTMIQFLDRIYDLDSGDISNATPKLFATNPIPHKLGEDDETPTIDKIFTEWVGEDYVQTLYEILAYCMLPDYPLHRIFCLVGSGMNGKGKYLELISRFIGEKNKTSTELDYLINNRFEAAKLYKKLVCLMGETNFTELNKTSLLKRLSGGDTIGYEFKNKDPFDDYNYAKIIIATNSLPKTTDKTRGFYRRWMLIDFPNEFSEQRDVLADIPDEEYRNLAKKCIGMLKGIMNNRRFHKEGDIEERMERYEARSNPVAQFLQECCIIDPSEEVPFFKLYDELSIYIKQRGHRETSKVEVGRVLRNDGFDIEKRAERVTDSNGKEKTTTWNYVVGLCIKEKGNLKYYKSSDLSINKSSDFTQFTQFTQNPTQFSHGNQSENGINRVNGRNLDSEKDRPVSEIHHHCTSCGNKPSHTYDSRGRPICKDCAGSLLANSIKVEEEEIEEE